MRIKANRKKKMKDLKNSFCFYIGKYNPLTLVLSPLGRGKGEGKIYPAEAGFSWLIVFLFFFSSFFSYSYAKEEKKDKLPLEVKSAVDKNTVSIGDKIRYTITVETDKDMEVEFPEFGYNLGEFSIKDFGSVKRSLWGKKRIIQWYCLDTYSTGKFTIPKAAVKYKKKGAGDWGEIESGELAIEVKSVLDKPGSAAVMRDIKGPVSIPYKFRRYLFVVILIVILSVIGFAVFLFKRKLTQSSITLKPAHQIAYEQLEELKRKNLIGEGKIKEFYIGISDIIRHYLENRFSLKAPEMTTEEFLINVKDYSELALGNKVLLREFLVCCDLVKFAKYLPQEAEVFVIFDSAEKFITQTKQEETREQDK